ncbi:Hypothetical predicted protein [Paramuricea clavata]|uniref:Uncharacterized protein n=1 Tax=Paramuricea clavata TaxID=317549 RepID=A0A7D9LWS3_PARCT|nr:Hypothetical predicted protein [Paramuricea clavata]
MLRQISYILALAILFAANFVKGDSDEDYNDRVIIIIAVAAVLFGLSLILLVLTACGIYALRYKRKG